MFMYRFLKAGDAASCQQIPPAPFRIVEVSYGGVVFQCEEKEIKEMKKILIELSEQELNLIFASVSKNLANAIPAMLRKFPKPRVADKIAKDMIGLGALRQLDRRYDI